MAFDISFIVYIQAEFVTQFVELVALWVVAQTDGVDVVLLHDFKVLAHQLFGHIVSGFRIMFVDIHTFQFDRLSIDEETYIWFAVFALFFNFLDFKAAETNLIRNHFCHLVAFLQCDEQLVKIRMFGCPCLYIRQLGFKNLVELVALLSALSYYISLCIQ